MSKKKEFSRRTKVYGTCSDCWEYSFLVKSQTLGTVFCRLCYGLHKLRKWCQENRERFNERARVYQRNNRPLMRLVEKRYLDKNPMRRKVKSTLFKKRLRQSTPKCLKKSLLKELGEIYRNRPEGHDVDHIIPLNGKDVCGLHVPWNLQYLPSSLNRSKGNKIWEFPNVA